MYFTTYQTAKEYNLPILNIINVNLSTLEYKSIMLLLKCYVRNLFYRVLNDSIERLYSKKI